MTYRGHCHKFRFWVPSHLNQFYNIVYSTNKRYQFDCWMKSTYICKVANNRNNCDTCTDNNRWLYMYSTIENNLVKASLSRNGYLLVAGDRYVIKYSWVVHLTISFISQFWSFALYFHNRPSLACSNNMQWELSLYYRIEIGLAQGHRESRNFNLGAQPQNL